MALDDSCQETEHYERQHAVADTFTAGEICGHQYRILSLLGRGGMGEVWEAEQLEPLRRMVALKVIKPGLGGQHVVDRFRFELQVLASLDHPNIVRAYDVDHEKENDAEIHFLVMEYIEGPTLSELVARRGTLRIAEACESGSNGSDPYERAHLADVRKRIESALSAAYVREA